MQTSTVFSIASFILAGTATWIATHHFPAPPAHVAAHPNDETAETTAQAAPPTPVQIVYQAREPQPAVAAAAVDAAGAPPPAAPAPPKPLETADLADAVEVEFRSQPDDASWSVGAREKLTDSLRPLAGDGARLRSVECRTSFCRVEMTHESTAAYDSFAHHMMDPSQRSWTGAVFSTRVGTPNDDGSSVTVTYLARDGYELPRPEGS